MLKFITKNKELLILLLILAIASFFRLWQLDKIPPGLYPDVAMNGTNAFDALKTHDFKVFYTDNNGREGFFINLDALAFVVFGVSIWSLRIVSVFIGILTVLGLYLLTKELFKNRNLALLSSFLLATSFWHTHFSRLGFRAIMVPFVLVFCFYFLFKGFNTKKIYNFILAGVFFGLGFHTYISFRLAVLAVGVVFLCWLIIYLKNKQFKQFFAFAVLFFLFTFLVALPIGIYFFKNPQDFIGRATGVSVFNTTSPIKAFAKSLILHLGMFNILGDGNWRHNYSSSPMLPWPLGILFLIGIFKSVYNILKKKDVVLYLFLFSWFGAMLLPGILTIEGIPHALRVVGVIPVVYIFTALGGYWLYNFIDPKINNKKILITICLLFLTIIGISEFHKYFFNWAKRPEVKDAFTENYAEIGNYLNSLPESTQKYVIVNELGYPLYGISIPAQTPMFIEYTGFGKLRATYLKAEELNKIKLTGKIIIIPLYENKIFEELQIKFPSGIIKQMNGFKIYEVGYSE